MVAVDPDADEPVGRIDRGSGRYLMFAPFDADEPFGWYHPLWHCYEPIERRVATGGGNTNPKPNSEAA